MSFPLSLLSMIAIQSAPAFAQDLSAALEEVVVTAQRREQNLQDVPISVSAFSGDVIEQRNIKSAIDVIIDMPAIILENSEQIYD